MPKKPTWKTQKYYHGPAGAHRRAVYKAMGYTTDDMKRPLIAIVNTWGEVCPGHYNLDHLTRTVRDGIWKAGGTPLEFTAISQCPTASLGEPSMRYDLPTRDLLAFDIEAIVEQQIFDGLVILVSCDKVVPGALLAAARLDLPCIILPGGCMEVGTCEGKKVTLSDLDEMVFGALPQGKADLRKIELLEDVVCPSPGACSIMGTANTMQCLAEAVGMTLPFAATARAVSAERLRLGKASGEAIVRMVFKGETARAIMGPKNLENMLRVCMALGGSTNGVLHILALARELGLEKHIHIEKVDEFSRTTPCISNVAPVGKYFLPDLHEDGGIPGVLAELKPLLHLSARGVDGRTLKHWIQAGEPMLKRMRRSILSLNEPPPDARRNCRAQRQPGPHQLPGPDAEQHHSFPPRARPLLQFPGRSKSGLEIQKGERGRGHCRPVCRTPGRAGDAGYLCPPGHRGGDGTGRETGGRDRRPLLRVCPGVGGVPGLSRSRGGRPLGFAQERGYNLHQPSGPLPERGSIRRRMEKAEGELEAPKDEARSGNPRVVCGERRTGPPGRPAGGPSGAVGIIKS